MKAALLIPCRNGVRFLPRLLATAAQQTRPFDEIWLYDDASTDASAALAEKSGARVIRGERQIGAPAGRNRLLEATCCDWVHFHDADDTLAPGFLATMAARADDGTDVVLCDVDWIDAATGTKCAEWRYRQADFDQQPLVALIHNTVGGIGGLYRRELLRRMGGFNEGLAYWEDTDLHIRLVRAGARVAVVNEVLSCAYRRPDSFSNGNLRAVWRGKSELLSQLPANDGPAVCEAVATDTELIARRQFRLGDLAGMSQSLAICRRAGAVPPTTRSAGLRWIARHLSSTGAFVLQECLHVVAEKARRPRP